MRLDFTIEVSGEAGVTMALDIKCVRSGRAEHLYDTYAWNDDAGE